MAKRAQSAKGSRKKQPQWEKRIDETFYLGGRRRGAILKEEAWFERGQVVKYSLAYMNPRVCAVDNGRVLGYDNSHDVHHRHSMGKTEHLRFSGYEQLVNRFEREVRELWRLEDEEDRQSTA
jgi:Family of unknown function (DUF6516)